MSALVLIDLQRAIDHPSWGVRNNPEAEQRGRHLLDAWRVAGGAVFHVRHDSVEPGSTYRPGQPLHAFKPEFEPRPGEIVIGKHTCDAFVDTVLEQLLREAGHQTLVIFGVITNNSVETTVRHAASLGFDVCLVEDACFTFNKRDYRGVERSAEEVHAMSLANLEGEYAHIATVDEVLLTL